MEICAVKFAGTDTSLTISVNGVLSEEPWSESPVYEIQYQPVKPGSREPRRMVFEPEGSSVLQPVRLMENTEYDFALTIKGSLGDLVSALTEHAFAPFRMDSLLGVASLNSREFWQVDGEWLTITGRMNFKQRAGRADLSVRLGTSDLAIFVDVIPAKVDYEEHFHVIVDALAKRHVELLLRLDTGVETALEALEELPGTPLQEMVHLRSLFESGSLEQSLRLIENNPTRRIRAERTLELTELCTDPDWNSFEGSPFESDWVHGGDHHGFKDGWFPVTLPTTRKETTNASKENRYVKHLLQVLASRLQALYELLPASQTASRFALRRWQNTLLHALSVPFWRDIEAQGTMPNSMALLYRAGYRDIIRSLAELSMALKLANITTFNEVSGELKPVFDLYETWSFFAFCDALSEVSGTDLSSKIELGADLHSSISVVGAIRAKPLSTVFQRRGTAVVFTVHYNRTFKRPQPNAWEESYSVRLRPDISLRIEIGGLAHWLHFDAKYRLDTGQLEEAWSTEIADDAIAQSFVDQDIHVMHTYRDAVLGTRGSFIMYPGREAKARIFTRHGEATYRKSEILPSVGAFPLLPSPAGRALQEGELVSFFNRIIDRMIASAGYQEETAFH